MARFYKKRTQNKGLPPGSLIFIGTKKVEDPTVEYISFNEDDLTESEFIKVENLPRNDPGKNQWYNIVGLDNVEFMAAIKERLHIHPLAMEDVMNTGQRAKFEEFEDFNFVSLKMLRFDEKQMKVLSEQVSFVLRDRLLISFQEENGDTFDPIRLRLRNAKGNIRRWNTDYLLYTLLDSIVDSYIYIIENIGEKIDDLELKVLEESGEEIIHTINTYKKELHFILKVARPIQELLHNLMRSESPFIHQKRVLPFYKDLADLITHAIESVETYRVILSDYIQLYHSNLSMKMNDIMKVLTIFSAIFIPLTFFAGIYGMNFEYIPELDYRYSYPIFWAVIVMMAIIMLLFFRRKKWF